MEELEEEEGLGVLIRFKEKNIGKCYKTAAEQYFLKDHPITII